MSEPHHHQIRVPRGALIGAGVLIALTLATVVAYRLAGVAPVAQVPDPSGAVEHRALRFEDGPDGAVVVYELNPDGPDRRIQVIETGQGGFIRGVLRSMARSRRAGGISPEHPFHLTRESNGKLVLEDPATGQRIDLRAFGPTNVESFGELLVNNGDAG